MRGRVKGATFLALFYASIFHLLYILQVELILRAAGETAPVMKLIYVESESREDAQPKSSYFPGRQSRAGYEPATEASEVR